ncbi:MAG: hypothetical protein QOF94_463 [Acidobacteriaceae bacterium]
MWWIAFTAFDLYLGLLILEASIPSLPPEAPSRKDGEKGHPRVDWDACDCVRSIARETLDRTALIVHVRDCGIELDILSTPWRKTKISRQSGLWCAAECKA